MGLYAIQYDYNAMACLCGVCTFFHFFSLFFFKSFEKIIIRVFDIISHRVFVIFAPHMTIVCKQLNRNLI